MTSTLAIETLVQPTVTSLRERIESMIDTVLASLPNADHLTAEEQRGIIARYTAVLEGNFIYWMTGAYIATKSNEARAKIMENLLEEVRDSHPAMMRRFAIAANAVPTDKDAAAVYEDLTNVRLFIGRLAGVPIVLTMAFFEGLIQRFMPYLADLAQRRGSSDMEYTDVHGVCDITHTEDLYRALGAEMKLNPPDPEGNLFEGVDTLRALMETIIRQEAA